MKYDLRELQLIILRISKEIKRICENNDINYTLIGGSLIGAVRHGGFIPWDDDMDFVMRREDYDKFRTCCESQLGDEYMLIDWRSNPYYGHGFMKIMLKGTTAIEQGKCSDKYPHHIYVDIFPFDYVAPTAPTQFFQRWTTYLSMRLVQEKSGSKRYKNFKGIKRFLYMLNFGAAHLFSHGFLVNLCESQQKKYLASTSYVTSMVGYYGYNKEIVPASYFDEFVSLKFEDTEFKAIKEYDSYLKLVFGDYMQLPPVEKRRCHELEKVDFGKYSSGNNDVS